ncbi:hypothetical protein [Deinococcus ficus]|uniref:hypothetical protein n=1 Tax=Deinococcus ficus TaxID=317577 RepID=UPI00174C8436|nr:hypothetical protein [Deinococcus ficus]GHF82059.1 hypothetical protein GCM10017782_19760 [Deinococcus ficus]
MSSQLHHLELRWRDHGTDEEPDVQILVDGRDFIDIVREWELDIARAAGEPTLAGEYGGIPKHFAGNLARAWLNVPEPGNPLSYWEGDQVILLACTCGELGCWPLLARVDVTHHEVRWLDFEQPHRTARHDEEVIIPGGPPRARARVWNYEGFGPFVFNRGAYTSAIDHLIRTTPSGLSED